MLDPGESVEHASRKRGMDWGRAADKKTFPALLYSRNRNKATRSAEDLFSGALGGTPHRTARLMHSSPMADGFSDRGGHRQFQQDIKIGKIVAE